MTSLLASEQSKVLKPFSPRIYSDQSYEDDHEFQVQSCWLELSCSLQKGGPCLSLLRISSQLDSSKYHRKQLIDFWFDNNSHQYLLFLKYFFLMGSCLQWLHESKFGDKSIPRFPAPLLSSQPLHCRLNFCQGVRPTSNGVHHVVALKEIKSQFL